MSKAQDICPSCGKPNQSDAKGSLTQWVFLCKCDLRAPGEASESNIQICIQCGKRIGAGRSGTFTQWIFRAEICDCENPQPASNTLTLLSNEEFLKSPIELESIVEIKVDEDKFPSERYAPLEILSSTNLSTVFLSIDRRLSTRVAIKVIKLDSPDGIVSFQKEVKALASLSHEGIVKVLDFAEKNGTPYMVMDYVDGITLRELLKLKSRLSVEDTLNVLKSLCRILSHCHGKNIFHRDIKPENLLICTDTSPIEITLIDFGLSCMTERTEKQGSTMAGTPPYMAPDVGKGKPYDKRSEIYSVGCLMFELLTGAPPYQADNPLQLLKLHADGEIPTLSSRIEDQSFDEQLEKIVERCLAKEPEGRFQSTKELLFELEKFESHLLENSLSQDTELENSQGAKLSSLESKKLISILRSPLAIPFSILILACITVCVYSIITNQTTKNSKGKSTFSSDPKYLLESEYIPAEAVLRKKTKKSNPHEQIDTGLKMSTAYLMYAAQNHARDMNEVMLNGYEPVSRTMLIKLFKRAKKLKIATFANSLCSPEYISATTKSKSLRLIRLIRPTVKDVYSIPRNMRRLRAVELNNQKITVQHTAALKSISKLKQVGFSFSDLDSGTIKDLSQISLTRLSFMNCSLWLEDFASLKDNKTIKIIKLKDVTVLDKRSTSSQEKQKSYSDKGRESGKFILYSEDDPLSQAPESLIKIVSQMEINRLILENMIFKKETFLLLSKIPTLEKVVIKNCDVDKETKRALKKSIPGLKINDIH